MTAAALQVAAIVVVVFSLLGGSDLLVVHTLSSAQFVHEDQGVCNGIEVEDDVAFQ